MEKLNRKTGVLYKLGIFMENRMEWLKKDILEILCWCWFRFLTEVWSLEMGCNWKYPSWYHDCYCFGYTLYFSIWSSILILIQCTLLCLYLFISISLCQHNIVFELVCLLTELISVFAENSRYRNIYLCLLDIICVLAMIFYWTLSLIQISNVGY